MFLKQHYLNNNYNFTLTLRIKSLGPINSKKTGTEVWNPPDACFIALLLRMWGEGCEPLWETLNSATFFIIKVVEQPDGVVSISSL